jgi:hypothetical protein
LTKRAASKDASPSDEADVDDLFVATEVVPERGRRWAAWVPIVVLLYGLSFGTLIALYITFSSFIGDRETAKEVTRTLLYPIGDVVLVGTGIAQAFLGYYVSNPTGAIIVAIPTSLLALPFGVVQASAVVALVLLIRRLVRFVLRGRSKAL